MARRWWALAALAVGLALVAAFGLRAALGLPASGHESRSLLEWLGATDTEPKVDRKVSEALIVARGQRGGERAR